jgi:4-diphosphocytidyl-2-C-methyl-D-erythritol kinase
LRSEISEIINLKSIQIAISNSNCTLNHRLNQMPSSIQVRSYAKINWTLDVLFKREDGYHELRTIYQTVSLHDTLSITETAGTIEILCDDPAVPCNETNLAFRAAVALRQELGTSKGARIEIHKQIPVAAGLGGGSSNAAATLLALTKLWEIDVDSSGLVNDVNSRDLIIDSNSHAGVTDVGSAGLNNDVYSALIKIAAKLGSDVPFFLTGGTALGIGRGEEVYSIQQVNWENLLLVNPGFTVSTPEAYAKLSRLTRSEAPLNIHFTLLAAKGISGIPLVATNDLEEVVIATHKEIAEVKRRLLSLGARHALMSGSGATVFGVFDNLQTTERAASMLHAAGYWAKRARTVDAREYQATIFQ